MFIYRQSFRDFQCSFFSYYLTPDARLLSRGPEKAECKSYDTHISNKSDQQMYHINYVATLKMDGIGRWGMFLVWRLALFLSLSAFIRIAKRRVMLIYLLLEIVVSPCILKPHQNMNHIFTYRMQIFILWCDEVSSPSSTPCVKSHSKRVWLFRTSSCLNANFYFCHYEWDPETLSARSKLNV